LTDQSSVGLVLGGGAALGAAHAGVLQALEEAGARFDVIAGTSAGAIIGGGYAAGITAAELVHLVLGARFSSFATFQFQPRWGLFDTTVMERSIEEVVGPLRIEQLERPFGALAFDLRRRQPVLLTTGPLSTALRASSAVPGLFPPVTVGGQLLVDGAVADNVPVFAAHLLGAQSVVAVDLTADTSNRPATRLATVARAAFLGQNRDTRAADVIIRPRTEGLSRWSPVDVAQLVSLGRAAVEENWADIAALLAQEDN
jgi:NTE family protein